MNLDRFHLVEKQTNQANVGSMQTVRQLKLNVIKDSDNLEWDRSWGRGVPGWLISKSLGISVVVSWSPMLDVEITSINKTLKNKKKEAEEQSKEY